MTNIAVWDAHCREVDIAALHLSAASWCGSFTTVDLPQENSRAGLMELAPTGRDAGCNWGGSGSRSEAILKEQQALRSGMLLEGL